MIRPTIFCDIDGLLLHHHGFGAGQQWHCSQTSIKGAMNFLDLLEKKGWYIVLVTARKECAREDTIRHLRDNGLIYDQLIMGVSSGPRILLNDSKPDYPETAFAMTLVRNASIDAESLVSKLEGKMR